MQNNHSTQVNLEALAQAQQAEARRWARPPGVTPSSVVSPSLQASEVAHTTPSPACTDAENAQSLRQSLRAKADGLRPLPPQQVAERRRQLALMRSALATVPAGKWLVGD